MKFKIFTTALILSALLVKAQDQEFIPNGKVFGEVFADYYYTFAADTAPAPGAGEYKGNQKNDNAFAIRRFNFGYEYLFSEKISGKLLLEGTDGSLISEDNRGVYIKNAYLKWKDIFAGSTLTVGGQPTNTYSISDNTWGYRSIEKDITDFRKHSSSNDWGVMLDGKILGDGLLNYDIMIGNGRAAKPENNKYKKISAGVTSKLMNENLLLNLYVDYEPTSDSTSKSMIKAFAGFINETFTVGIEPFVMLKNTPDTKPFGIEIFANITVNEQLKAFGRLDIYNPDTEADNTGYSEIFTVFGIDYSPVKKVSIMPNLWINIYGPKDNAVPELDPIVVARLTFRYKF